MIINELEGTLNAMNVLISCCTNTFTYKYTDCTCIHTCSPLYFTFSFSFGCQSRLKMVEK